MHKVILAAALSAVVAGCASYGGTARDGRTYDEMPRVVHQAHPGVPQLELSIQHLKMDGVRFDQP